MLTQTKKPLIILACVLAVVLLAAAAYFLFAHFSNTAKDVLVRTFVCPDESHYIVIQEENTLLISGSVFDRIEESSRYSNGVSEVELSEEAFTLKSGETTVTCMAGVPASGEPPIISE